MLYMQQSICARYVGDPPTYGGSLLTHDGGRAGDPRPHFARPGGALRRFAPPPGRFLSFAKFLLFYFRMISMLYLHTDGTHALHEVPLMVPNPQGSVQWEFHLQEDS